LGAITNRYLYNVMWQSAPVGDFMIQTNEVHVWRINISQNIGRLKQFEALLTPEETMRAGKYKQQKDTYRFIVSRGMQRVILGRYMRTSPGALEFVLSDNKKPYLLNKSSNNLFYNLSHSGDWIVLAISDVSIGTDVELIDPTFPFQDILADNFSRAEIDYIGISHQKFFKLWTRKEAILKATGQGLGDHLKVTPALNGEYDLNTLLKGADKRWTLHSFDIAPAYISTVVYASTERRMQFFDAELL
jgi:4'-phosphopantetheinyl transferase